MSAPSDGVRGGSGGRRRHEAPAARGGQPALFPALVAWSLLQGIIAFIPLGTLCVVAIKHGMPETDARSLTFVSLVLVDLGLVLVNRSFAPSVAELIFKANRALIWVVDATLSVLVLVLITPIGRALFRFG